MTETGRRTARRIEVSNHYDKIPFVGTYCENEEHSACPWSVSESGQCVCKCKCHKPVARGAGGPTP